MWRLLGVVGFALALSACHQNGTVFAVDTTDDTVDATPGDGFCADTNGDCSLRAAVMEANALPGVEEIALVDGAHYIVDLEDSITPSDATADIDVTEGVVIVGEGLVTSINDRIGGLDPAIFHVRAPGLVEFRGTRFARTEVAIRASGPGVTSVDRALFDEVGDIGLDVHGGIAWLTMSTFTFPQGGSQGVNVEDGRVHVENTTMHGLNSNDAVRNLDGTVTVLHSTFDASVDQEHWGDGSITIQSSIVTRGCDGDVISLGHNYGPASCASEPSDVIQAGYPDVGPLIEIGGPVPVLRVDPTSPAVDAAETSGCTVGDVDTRDVDRPQGAACDIGALEVDAGDCGTLGAGADVRFCDLSDLDATGLDLSGLDAVGALMPRVDATGADLSGADLRGVGLRDAVFADTDLSDARISQGRRSGHPAYGSFDAPGADFTGAELDHVHIYDATGANFTDARLNGSVLSDIFDANPASMTDAIVEGADFSEAWFWGVTSGGIVGTPAAMRPGSGLHNGYIIDTFVEIDGADFSGVDFGSTSLGRASIYNSDLTDAVVRQGSWAMRLDGSTLDGAVFAGIYAANASMRDVSAVSVDFSGAIFGDGSWAGALVVGSDFTDAIMGTSYTGAIMLLNTYSNTTCPSGVNSDDNGGNCDGQFTYGAPSVGGGALVPAEFEGMSVEDFAAGAVVDE